MPDTTPDLPDLSRAEFSILQVLWKHKKLTVREVHEQLKDSRGWAYTTTKTMMDRMVKKGLMAREDFHGIFLYRPLISRPRGMARMVAFFADRVLEMDTGTVVAMFADSGSISDDEIKELEALLDDLNQEGTDNE
ncbi:BlaI/MecI/CopY family transcriptional regulator [bacterium]|nr:BlaI/MecI/CopY family transcriptional regulator [bacterium]